MSLDLVQAVLADVFRLQDMGDVIRITTHCLYPSHGFVDVYVRRVGQTFLVSDDGGAVREIEAAGAEIAQPDTLLRPLVDARGLTIVRGAIQTHCSLAVLPAAVALVANASREVADWLFDHMPVRKP